MTFLDFATATGKQRKELIAKARKAAELMKALSHEGRLLILCLLAEGEKTVTEIGDIMDMPQAGVSQQLSGNPPLKMQGKPDALHVSADAHQFQNAVQQGLKVKGLMLQFNLASLDLRQIQDVPDDVEQGACGFFSRGNESRLGR